MRYCLRYIFKSTLDIARLNKRLENMPLAVLLQLLTLLVLLLHLKTDISTVKYPQLETPQLGLDPPLRAQPSLEYLDPYRLP